MLGLGLTAGAEQLQPTQVAPDDFPYITVETNLVMNEASKLPQVIEVEEDGAAKEYGFIEVALRVGPGSGTEEQMLQVFAALAYDSAVLTPVTWNAENPDTGKRDLYQVMNIAGATPATPLVSPALKADVMDTGAARILGADEDGYVAFSLLAGVDSVPTTLKGTADAPTTLHGDSRLVAVRFRYDAAAHPFSYDAENKVILDGDATLTRPLITWANDANAAGSDGGMSLAYVGGTPDKQMYFVAAAPDPTDTTKWTVVDGLNKPTTSSVSIIKAVDAAGTGYSYESNFFPVEDAHLTALGLTTGDPRIRFTQVMGVTADQGSGGISLDDLSTILFYDWDDTLLGALTVPKGVDVRETVNDYVRDNFIHPELRYDKDDPTAPNPDLDSVARKDSYRGTFPYDNPGGAEFSGTGIKEDADGDGEVDANAGSRFPLTNKLDYILLKKPLYYNENDDMWALNDADYPDGYDEEFPYVHGWAVTSPANLPYLWTTLGSGELESYYAEPGYVELFVEDEIMQPIFKVADFRAIKESIVCAKALYEPAESLSDLDYTASGLRFTRYGTNGGEKNGSYSIQFTYNRVNENYGVKRARNPSVRVEMVPDVSSVANTVQGNVDWMYWELFDWLDIEHGVVLEDFSTIEDILINYELNAFSSSVFPSELRVDNSEKIAVDITPSSAIQDVNYILVENYGRNNYIEAGSRSEGNEFGVQNNYTPNPDTGDRQGTDGFVFKGSLGIILEQGTLKAQGKSNSYDVHVILDTFQDLKLRYNATTEFNAIRAITGRNMLATAISEAWNNGWIDEFGNVDLCWHQLQYYLINGTLVTKNVAQAENYSWYCGPAV